MFVVVIVLVAQVYGMHISFEIQCSVLIVKEVASAPMDCCVSAVKKSEIQFFDVFHTSACQGGEAMTCFLLVVFLFFESPRSDPHVTGTSSASGCLASSRDSPDEYGAAVRSLDPPVEVQSTPTPAILATGKDSVLKCTFCAWFKRKVELKRKHVGLTVNNASSCHTSS